MTTTDNFIIALGRVIGTPPIFGREAVRRHWVRSRPVNDNKQQPKGDRWARLIMGWSSINQALGLHAYRARQAGEDFDAYVTRMLLLMEAGR